MMRLFVPHMLLTLFNDIFSTVEDTSVKFMDDFEYESGRELF
jgi:hypothetical protein